MSSTRREFIQAAGALTICFSIPACSNEAERTVSEPLSVGNRLRLYADGRVELILGKVELGQGIGTALAQIAAEELGVEFEQIALLPVDTAYSPDESYTFSSISIQQSGSATRRAAATARAYLLAHTQEADGAEHWPQLSGKTVEIDSDATLRLKSVQDYQIVGQSMPRIDIPAKVFGGPSFLQDVRLPDMLHARIVRPHAERANIEEIDVGVAQRMAGVVAVIRDGNFLAVIASQEHEARRAAAALRRNVTWALANDLPDEDSMSDWLKSADLQVESVAEVAAPPDRLTETENVSASYQRAYQAHASISPSAAIAEYDGKQMTVWSHAQGMYPLRGAIASVLGLSVENVRCLHFEASGCYGHNGADDAACDAAAIALHYPGQPIRLQWERHDEMAWEPYGSAMHLEVEAKIDGDGNIRGWNYDLWSTPHASRPRSDANAANLIYAQQKAEPFDLPPIQSIPQPNGGADRNAIPLYAFEDMAIHKHLVKDVPIRVSALRGLGAYANVFAIESFMDELAARAGVDPLDYRLRHLQDDRAMAVLNRLADISGWRQRSTGGPQDGWGLGFARFKNRSSYAGILARVSIEEASGTISVKHVTAVCDAGLVVNPDGVIAQIEGGIVQSCSWTLMERVRFDRSLKRSLDWSSYPIIRFDAVPDITVELMARDDQPALGVGETAQGPTAAAIANAVHDATGMRLRQLPLKLG